MKVASYENLLVWQKSMDVVIKIYDVTREFPSEEKFGLISQMRRAAVSIPSNVAEGSRRGSRKDFRNFILMAYGSGAELETQLKIALRLSYGNKKLFSEIETLLDEVMRMLNALANKLKSPV